MKLDLSRHAAVLGLVHGHHTPVGPDPVVYAADAFGVSPGGTSLEPPAQVLGESAVARGKDLQNDLSGCTHSSIMRSRGIQEDQSLNRSLVNDTTNDHHDDYDGADAQARTMV